MIIGAGHSGLAEALHPVIALAVDEPGCVIAGLGLLENGLAFAAKSWTGLFASRVIGLNELMDRVGIIPDFQQFQLAGIARPELLGGGMPVGVLQPFEI